MCLDFHSDYPYLLAAGFYNGTVKVFDLRKSHLIKQHIILMNENSQKHYDPVWQVKWQKDDIYDRKNFYSISSDGKMINWTLINVILIKFLLK
jgi:dynein intermediate chain 1